MALKGSEKLGTFDKTEDLWNLPARKYWISEQYGVYFFNDVDDPEYWFGNYVRKNLEITMEEWESADEWEIAQWFEQWYDAFEIVDISSILVSIGDAYDSNDKLVMDVGVCTSHWLEMNGSGEEYFNTEFSSMNKYTDALEWAKIKGINEAEKLVSKYLEKGYTAIIISDYVNDPDGPEIERHNL